MIWGCKPGPENLPGNLNLICLPVVEGGVVSEKFMQILTILFLCLFLTGCIGVEMQTFHSGTEFSDRTGDREYDTEGEVIRRNGEPSEIMKISDKEEIYLYYNLGLGWTGFVPIIWVSVIPVPMPLVIPTRKNYTEYHLVSGVVQSVTTHTTIGTDTACIFGLMYGDNTGFDWGWGGCKTQRTGLSGAR